MASNGNSGQLQASDPLESLERTLRGAQPAVPVQADPSTSAQETVETYDAMMRGRDTVQMLRDMAAYNNEVADAIERTMATWHGHSTRLMGKVGK